MKVEILAPAGSGASAEAALCAGADAVYIGGSLYGARAYADNPDEEQLLEIIDYVHLHGRKIFLAVNTLLKDTELAKLDEYLFPYYTQGLDAVIVQDAGVMQYIKRRFPDMAIHVSTQACVTNMLGAAFFKKAGADRIVPARELSLSELREMKEGTGLEIECFVHGAMCYCYSGQCLLSSMIGARSGNRGQCAQPCRLPYAVQGKRPSDLLSMKDLCAIELIPDLIESGIDSFKIEGRMKQPEYVYAVVSMYRKYVDLYYEKGKSGYRVSEEDKRCLEGAYLRRGYCSGYYERQNGKEMISLTRPQRRLVETVQKDYKIKEKINGKFIFSEGKCAKLCLEHKGTARTVRAEFSGEAVQTARKAPLEEERLDRQLRKTGDTPFVFDRLEIIREGNGFLPMQSVNALRRGGMELLEKKILSGYRRKTPQFKTLEPAVLLRDVDSASQGEGMHELSFEIYVQERGQLAAAAAAEAATVIYVDGAIAFDREILQMTERIRKGGKKMVFAVLPYVFRRRAVSYYETAYGRLLAGFDGVLLRNFESLEWLDRKNYPKKKISDSGMYVFNHESKDFMRKSGIDRFTYPAELNQRELKALGGGGILPVYGYQPVMVTANCIKKTTGACTAHKGTIFLTDRYGKKFAVKNDCRNCYNVIYNCAPLMLPDLAEEVKEIRPRGVRLDFTLESEEEGRRILDLYERAFLRNEEVKIPDMEYTRGHMKRGVR